VPQPPGTIGLETVHDLLWRKSGWSVDTQMDVVWHNLKRKYLQPQLQSFLLEEVLAGLLDLAAKHLAPSPGCPHEVVVQEEYGGVGVFIILPHKQPYGSINQ